jgi:hydrogenase maturation protein HypF
MTPARVARQLSIRGVVQGVGFRPFLFSLAREHRIAGEVANTGEGVMARVEGTVDDLDRFMSDITARQPRLARVDRIDAVPLPVRGGTGFRIISSRPISGRAALISPDVCVCDDCLEEMGDPSNRRYGYPFINCTHCGPRFTIITDIPYDRPCTAMKDFVMCPDCRAEYENPADRRFHAQPNACPVCGPQVFLTDRGGTRIAGPDPAVALAADRLKQGDILAVKGLGGFHLAVNAADDRAVRRLRKRKNRPCKPFALMARSLAVLEGHVLLSQQERELLQSCHRPIVLAAKRPPGAGASLSPALAPRNACLGVMLPYTPLHFLLLEKGPDILVMTSGNRSGDPLSIDNQDALDAFSHIADFFLLHNRDIYFRADDSIVRIQAQQPRFIRRSRGYAPLPVQLSLSLPPVLACGAGMKNTICLTRDTQAFLSQHIGDLENQKTNEFFTRTIGHYKKILDVVPRAVAHDLHPGYMSTDYARQYAATMTGHGPGRPAPGNDLPETLCTEAPVPRVAVQHHHAHAVSCMAENHVDGPVTAIVLDGTGYGTDGCIWGGEVLIATRSDFVRRAHLRYIPMPGGDRAVLEPWRMAASVLFTAFGSGFLDLDLPWIKALDKTRLAFICRMMENQVNTPMTSSCGRLFDAVSSLLGIRHRISYESQAAMELEAAAAASPKQAPSAGYCFLLDPAGRDGSDDPVMVIDMMPGIREMVADIQARVPAGHISRRFHKTVVQAFARAAYTVAAAHSLDRVVLSGGVFHNDAVLTGMIRALEEKGLTVFTHTRVPAGDGGISLGQAVVAGTRLMAAAGGAGPGAGGMPAGPSEN